MFEKYYPNSNQLFGLHCLLTFLSKSKLYWHKIELIGGTIVVKAEPPKGDIDIRVLYVYKNGKVDTDELRN